MEDHFGAHDVLIVPNAVPIEVGTDAVEGGARRSSRALYLGGFSNPVKGGATLAEALALLPEDVAEDIDFVIAGPGDPPSSLLSQLHRGKAGIHLQGWLDEPAKREAMAESGIFVLPSTSEGLPVALLEAMASGMAIVATDVGGIPDVVEHDSEALVVPPGEPQALADAIALLARDAELRNRLGSAARRRAATEHNLEAVCSELDRLYRRYAR